MLLSLVRYHCQHHHLNYITRGSLPLLVALLFDGAIFFPQGRQGPRPDLYAIWRTILGWEASQETAWLADCRLRWNCLASGGVLWAREWADFVYNVLLFNAESCFCVLLLLCRPGKSTSPKGLSVPERIATRCRPIVLFVSHVAYIHFWRL